MDDFHISRPRDAYFVVRGFKYQVDHTILRWLGIHDHEILKLEAGEDIDVITSALPTSVDTPAVVLRELSQIKHYDGSITLRMPGAVAAMANFAEHRFGNIGGASEIRFCFCTNATAVAERPSPFEDRTPAIHVWESIRHRQYDPTESKYRIARLRDFVRSLARPAQIPFTTWRELERLLALGDNEFGQFVESFEWSTGQTGSVDIVRTIRDQLLLAGHCQDLTATNDAYSWLFLHVMTSLSKSGDKTLTKAGLRQELNHRPTRRIDHARLRWIEQEIFALTERVEDLERISAAHAESIKVVELHVASLAISQGVSPHVQFDAQKVVARRPARVTRLCKRSDAVATLLTELTEAFWLAIHGGIGTGKTQLTLLTSEVMSQNVIWLSLRDTPPAIAPYFIRAALSDSGDDQYDGWNVDSLASHLAAMPSDALVVIDDLPDIEPSTLLFTILTDLAFACIKSSRRLVTTSHFRVPAALHEVLPKDSFSEVLTPRLTDDEIVDLFNAHAAPEGVLSKSKVAKLNMMAEGHPALLTAVARHFAGLQWKVNFNELDKLLDSESVNQVISESIRKLLRNVQDADTRQLLYRLGLPIGEYTNIDICAVASAAPVISAPREKADSLFGLWIEQTTEMGFVTSPLIKPLCETELGAATRAAVYSAIADVIILGKSMTTFGVAKAISYLFSGELFDRAAIFAMTVLRSASRLPKEQRKELLEATGFSGQLPKAINIGLRLYLRATHVKMAESIGMPVDRQLREIEKLARNCDRENLWATYYAGVTVLPIASRRDFALAISLARCAIQAYPEMVAPGCSVPLRLRGFSRGDLIWFLIGGITSFGDLKAWLGLLDCLTKEELQKHFQTYMSDDGSKIAVDHLWVEEHKKPKSQQNWRKVLENIEWVIEFAARKRIQRIWACAIAAKIIVLGEYLREIALAEQTGTEALAKPKLSLRSKYLICDALGRQHLCHKQHLQGEAWLRKALSYETSKLQGRHVTTWMDLGRAIGAERPQEAVSAIEQAVTVAREKRKRVSDLAVAVALAELGIAHWLAGDLRSSFDAFDEAVELLLNYNHRNDVWKERLVTVGHATGFLMLLATEGEPPLEASDGSQYIPPFLGMVNNASADAASLYDADNEVGFYVQMSEFACGVGNMERSCEWALSGIEKARESGFLTVISLLGMNALAGSLGSRDYPAILDLSLESSTALVATMQLHQLGNREQKQRISVPTLLGSRPSTNWNHVDRLAVVQGLFPLIMSLKRSSLNEVVDLPFEMQSVGDACKGIATHTGSQLWNDVGEICHNFAAGTDVRVLHQAANAAASRGLDVQHMLGYLAASCASNFSLANAAINQAMVLAFLTSGFVRTKSLLYRYAVLPFVCEFWRHSFENERFRFKSPQVFASSLEDSIHTRFDSRGQMVLKTVFSGLGVRLPALAHQAADWLEER